MVWEQTFRMTFHVFPSSPFLSPPPLQDRTRLALWLTIPPCPLRHISNSRWGDGSESGRRWLGWVVSWATWGWAHPQSHLWLWQMFRLHKIVSFLFSLQSQPGSHGNLLSNVAHIARTHRTRRKTARGSATALLIHTQKSHYRGCKRLCCGDTGHICVSCLLEEEWRKQDLYWDQNVAAYMKGSFHYSKRIIVILKEINWQFQRPALLLYPQEKH